MARRKKETAVDALIEAVSRMPWWMGVALALLSYMVLHAFATRPPPVMTAPTQISSSITHALVNGLASVGQYLLPLLFSIGALVSFFKRRSAKQLHDSAAQRDDGIANMAWGEFETLVGEFFRRQGYIVMEQGGARPDGGVDVLLQKGSDRYLVQCKHWRALRVGVQPVRELYGVMAARRVAGGFVVTSGDFTEEARSFAQGRELQLINGKMLQSGIRAQAMSASQAGTPVASPAQAVVSSPAASTVPTCPLCHAAMVLRQSKNGPTPGKQFWGCSTFAETKCRGTREMI